MEYSVVIPVKNEEENLEPLVAEIEPVMASLGLQWELIIVDDGSDDRSREIVRALQKSKPYLRLIAFKRNYGQSSAFDAGFKAARGRYTITLDGDRQNDPSDIPKLVAVMNDCDLACGWRRDRHDPLMKRISSKIANTIRSRMCQDYMHDTGCSLKVYRSECLKQIKLYHGMHRFLPALFLMEGFRVKEVPVRHRDRSAGTSKYGLFNRLIGPLMDMFAVRWMRQRRLCYEVEPGSE